MGLWLAWLPWAAGNLDHVMGMQWGGALLLWGAGGTRDSLGEAWATSLPGPLPQLVSGCAGSSGGLYMG